VRQVLPWLYERDAMAFDEMTDLSARERAALAEAFALTSPALARAEQSTDGTVKHLWRMDDGELLESVLIPSPDRLTLCLSSQAGCAMACVFCATGWSGYRRQLTTGEIVAQYRGARRWAQEHGLGAITNIVFMGMGEPLANRPAVMPALTLLNGALRHGRPPYHRVHGGRGAGHPGTGRTAGTVPAGALPARAQPGAAAPARAAGEEVPAARAHGGAGPFEAAGGRRITFEYVMIAGVNDELDHARELARLVHRFQSHVNLIPFNPIPGTDWQPSPPERLRAFAALLEEEGVPATVRSPRGRDIAAACGQLRAEHETKPPRPYLNLVALGGRRRRAEPAAAS
jgi:23S rRNA (adenine2503-C2)-methyltransferase